MPGRYQLAAPDANGYWIAGIGFLGVWQGNKANRTGYWLRWWDEAGKCCCGERNACSRAATAGAHGDEIKVGLIRKFNPNKSTSSPKRSR